MFTGIIQQLGKVTSVDGKNEKRFWVSCNHHFLQPLQLDDSISVNGVCETIINKTASHFEFYVSPHTLSLTNLKYLSIGSFVNLEKPLTLQQFVGGHLVQGHVDGLGRIISVQPDNDSLCIWIEVSDDLSSFFIERASVALDGISLTVSHIGDQQFAVIIIPSTQQKTTLQFKQANDWLNIEVDIIAKYARHWSTITN